MEKLNLKYKASTKKGISFWKGSIKIDDNLTLSYMTYRGSNYYHTSVGSDENCSSGVYFQCEDLLDTLELAKIAISDFAEKVRLNPSEYYTKDV